MTSAEFEQWQTELKRLDDIEKPKVKLNVGCGRNPLPGWINLDSVSLPGVDIATDLEKRIPILDNTVDEFLLSHVLEHIHNTLGLMQELHRIAKPGALMTIRCPYGSSDDAWEDPTHVRPYFLGSFGYFGQPNYWQADYGYRGDWQVKKITLIADEPFFKAVRPVNKDFTVSGLIRMYRNLITEMVAELEAVKPIREPLRELQEVPKVVISS